MEIIQGKPKDKKIVIAQEIAFAKALSGNNKTLRDRALKKLKKWLTLRGNGKWTFTEEEFLRIWTGLFYCMWMSDKFLIQEELAESISSLVHCFKKNSQCALLFIECFNKRILMDWEGLDQYRIDKFNMLVRRFLRQTFVYIQEKEWEESLLRKLMGIFYNVILHRDNSLGFVLHFINIYAEELAKVGKEKISKTTVLTLIEPFVKLLARSKDMRIQKEAEGFFVYLMRQTDVGIDFDEKFNAWREQGFPGNGPLCMGVVNNTHENHHKKEDEGNINDDECDDDEDENYNFQDKPLDPRAGSVHVYLPQIPIDVDGCISLFKKYQNSKQASNKGRKILKCLTQKYGALSQGKFPMKVKKDPILMETKKKRNFTVKNAKKLLEFTKQINEGPIMTKEFSKIHRELEEQDDINTENDEVNFEKAVSEAEDEIEKEVEESNLLKKKINNKVMKKKKKSVKMNKSIKETGKTSEKLKVSNELMQEIKENTDYKENNDFKKQKNKKVKNSVQKKKLENSVRKKKLEENIVDEDVITKTKNNQKVKRLANGLHENNEKDFQNEVHVTKKRKVHRILSNWQVQELDQSSPEYYSIKTPKIIRLEKKVSESREENEADVVEEKEWKNEETPCKEIVPVFWEKARQKVNKKSGSKSEIYVNPFAKLETESKSQGRRISFALDKNMAQENEQYLKEVKNSPKVPFDGSKKPVQSALKSGLAPSPVNPFYRFKKIKF